jgi:anthranilate synthase component II
VIDEELFDGLENDFEVGRYHSWVVERSLPACLEATSHDENGQVMSLRHREYDVRGVQFHPESVLTPDGKKMIKNWIKGSEHNFIKDGEETKPEIQTEV